ncbi:uncharacterized protein METZ01_LOCUS255287 [marine metagenome]|uniref:Uncharacterized protein n=1 Tax=marine metagenome TaxID=408172 RepID=A0A382IU92_9ZZZZ
MASLRGSFRIFSLMVGSFVYNKIVLQPITKEKKMTITDPRLARETTRVPRRSDYVKRPVLSATIHPDLKRTLVAMSERTGMSVSKVTDEVLYKGLIEMQELPEL